MVKLKSEDWKDQHARFLETARALGCDEDEATFDERLRRVVKSKPEKRADSPHAKVVKNG